MLRFIFSREQGRGFANVVTGIQPAPGGCAQLVRRSAQTKLRIDFSGRVRDEWPEQHRENTARFREVVKDLSEPRGPGGVLRKLERRGLVHVLIGASHQ